MILSMNQPCYIPWYGFVERVGMSDVHVIGDDKQFVKTEIQTRNRIRTKDGVRWLTVPVRGHSAGKMIRDVEIADTQWQNKHITNLKVSYKKAPFFQTYGPRYETLLSQGWKYLSDLNVALQKQIVNDFGFKTKMILGSELQVEGSRGEYLFNLCRELDADVYVTTAKAKAYLPEDKFERAGIKIAYHVYEEEPYQQVYPGFEPFMSALERLFCTGKPKAIEPQEILNTITTYRD